jgi:transcriptional regulator with XRE-family HTH domain
VLALREALRDTQEQFAERIGCSVESVGKWEQRVKPVTPGAKYAACLDVILRTIIDNHLEPDQLGRFRNALEQDGHDDRQLPQSAAVSPPIIASEGPRRATADQIEDDDMQRRQLIVGSAAAGVTLMARLSTGGERVGRGDVTALAERVDSYNHTEQQVGGGALADHATNDFQQARYALDNFDTSADVAEAFASATGNMAVMAGWLHYDSDDQTAATACYREALALAAQTGDDELAVHTCLNMALQNITQARRGKANPQAALRYTVRAAALTQRHTAGRIHALIASRQALAYAAMGDHNGFGRSVNTAWREMDMAHGHEALEDCPLWLRFMSHNEVRYHEASCYAYLGAASKSADLFSVVAAERAGQRNAANYRAWLAYSLSRVGDVTLAVGEARDVLKELSTGVSSGRTLRVMESVRAAADPERHPEFCRDYDLLLTSA